MGSPGYTVFCKNGHIVKQVPHHYIDNAKIQECHYCGSNFFHTEIEWGDLDYGVSSIPQEPIKEEWLKVDTNCIRGEIKVSIYDVSSIKVWKENHL